MLLWPNRLKIFNHAFRCIMAGTSNVFDGKEFKRGATVLHPTMQYTIFALMAKNESFLGLVVKRLVK